MLRIRVTAPAAQRSTLLQDLTDDPAVVNIVVLADAVRKPDGDLVTFDVAREAANDVIDRLRALGLHRTGSIAVERIDVSISDAAARAEALAPGDPSDAVIWEEKDVRVVSAGADEAPGVYKDIHQVMAAQSDLVQVIARFDPKIVKMCADDSRAED